MDTPERGGGEALPKDPDRRFQRIMTIGPGQTYISRLFTLSTGGCYIGPAAAIQVDKSEGVAVGQSDRRTFDSSE